MDPSELDKLISKLESHTQQAARGDRPWSEVWNEIKHIGGSFKEARYPSKGEKNDAWEKFQEIVESVKDAQAEERKQWERNAENSAQLRNRIISQGEYGRPPNALESVIGDLIFAPLELMAEAIVDIATLGLFHENIDHEKEALKAYSKNLKQAWDEFKEHKDDMLGKDKHEVFQTLRQIQDELDAAWEAWKKLNDQFYEAKRRIHRDRVEASIGKLESRLENLYSILSKKEAHLSELENKRDSARSDDFRSVVEGWIDEEENGISDVKEQISQVEGWLSEQHGKL